MALEPVAAPAIILSSADTFARVVHQCHEEMYIVQREESKSEERITCARENAGACGAGGGLDVELE